MVCGPSRTAFLYCVDALMRSDATVTTTAAPGTLDGVTVALVGSSVDKDCVAKLDVKMHVAVAGDCLQADVVRAFLTAPGAVTCNGGDTVRVEVENFSGDTARVLARCAAFRAGQFVITVSLPAATALPGGGGARVSADIEVEFPPGPPTSLELLNERGERVGNVLGSALSYESPVVFSDLVLQPLDRRGDPTGARISNVVVCMRHGNGGGFAALLKSASEVPAHTLVAAALEGNHFGRVELHRDAVADVEAVRGQFEITVDVRTRARSGVRGASRMRAARTGHCGRKEAAASGSPGRRQHGRCAAGRRDGSGGACGCGEGARGRTLRGRRGQRSRRCSPQ